MSGRNNINYDFMIATYAAILMKTNHADQALEYLNREISEAPSYPGAWSTRSDLHYQQGDLTAARTDAESALRLDPRDPKAQLVLQMLNAAGSSATSQAGR
jgi:Tfp pilus assembly protein PilF